MTEKSKPIFLRNCPIRERTADGISVGRCWHYLKGDDTCPRHGNVKKQAQEYAKTGMLQDEDAK